MSERRYTVKRHNGNRPTTAHIYDAEADNESVCEYLSEPGEGGPYSESERRAHGWSICKWCSGEADPGGDVENRSAPDWDAYRTLKQAAEADDE